MAWNKSNISFFLLIITILYSCTQNNTSPELAGPYLGLTPPTNIPVVFAPGIISTGHHEHSVPSFSPDGTEVIWTSVVSSNRFKYRFPINILSKKMINGVWGETEFKNISFNGSSGEGFFSPDGNKIFFSSDSTMLIADDGKKKMDIWYVEKNGQGWSNPVTVGSPVNTENHEQQPTVTIDSKLYFLGHYEGGQNNYGIYRSEFIDGKYGQPELLPENINSEHIDWTPFIAPDESFLLFSSFRPGGFGSGDIYVSFRDENDNWLDPVNLGPEINKGDNERYPYVSPDGKYLFFITDKVSDKLLQGKEMNYSEMMKMYKSPGNGYCDIYWVDAKVIFDLKPENIK